MFQFFFLLIFIDFNIRQEAILCNNVKPGQWIFYDNTSVVCDDDITLVPTQYPFLHRSIAIEYYDPALQKNTKARINVGSKTDLAAFVCSQTCSLCLNDDKDQCLVCAGNTRGPINYITASEIVSKSTRQCPCRENFVVNGSKCDCLDGFYIQLTGILLEQFLCLSIVFFNQECPVFMKTCEVVYQYPDARSCNIGAFRVDDRYQNCSCIAGYEDSDPPTVDCVPECKPPCSSCVQGFNQKCATCFDSQMKINSLETCECPSNTYLSLDKKTCICMKFYIYQVCDYTCGTCAQSSTNCVTCSYISNRIYSQGSCPCSKYYFAVDGQAECIACQWSCESCDSVDSCIDCPALSNREKNFLLFNDNYCNCIQGYAEDISSGSCQPCIDTCLTCNPTTDTCSSCDILQFRQLVDSQCVCLERYYSTKGDPICKQCDSTCLSCDGDYSNNCISCEKSVFRILNNKKECVCQQGYGYDDQGSEQCLQCEGLCLECGHYQNCLRCPTDINRRLDQNNKCVCDDGFYEDQFSFTCQPCHHSCLTCLDGSDSCLTCNTDMARVLNQVNKNCNCEPGYYEFYKKCIPCYYTCLTCISQFKDGCTSCPSSRQFEQQNLAHSSCVCKSIQQIDDGKSLECTSIYHLYEDCHYSCQTCDGPEINNCLTCIDNYSNDPQTINRLLKFGVCTCPIKWFDDQTNEICLKCHNSCETCFDLNEYSCITCSEIENRIQKSNSCFCQDGYFENSSTLNCDACDYRCATCEIDKTNCLTCMIGSFRELVQQTIQSQYKTCQCSAQTPNDVEGNPVCQICHFTCKNCFDNGYNQCTTCEDTANRVIKNDNTGSKCECKITYYDIQTPECAQCSSFCLGCVDSPNNCTSCNPQQFRELDGNNCKCAIRFGTQYLSYFENSQDPECTPCHYSCYTCYGEQYYQCLTCSDLDYRVQQLNECVCKPNYIDNGQGKCMGCNYTCLTCAGQNSLCASCPPNSLRTLNSQQQSCDCPQGYFDSGVVLCQCNILLKIECNITCATCTNRADLCLSCSQGSNRALDQFTFKCECISGYYDTGNGNCLECHFSCLQCSGPSKSECISCPDFISTKRALLSQECICADQFYDDSQNQLCQPCSSTCQTCKLNQNSCTQCVTGQNRILQGQQCTCQASYYESGGPACSKCDNLCQECQTKSTTCTKCDPLLLRTLNSGKCECNLGYYDDGSLTCKKCHYSCLACTNHTDCTSCDVQKFRYLNANSCPCQSGTIDQGVELCFTCDTRCLTCTNITTQCLTCDSTKLRILNGQQCQCQDGYYENNIKQCLVCDTKCLTCINNSTTCTSCSQIQNKTLDSGTCICKNGYYMDTNENCQQCSNKCQTCVNTATKCTSCQVGRILVINQCNCQSRYYEDGSNQCQQCNYTCLTCSSSATNCLSCDSTSNRSLSQSKCICNKGFYDIGAQNCLPCHLTCLTCQIQNTSCTSCEISYQRVLNGSVCECTLGYFDSGIQLCQKCDPSCLTCIQSSSKCTSCDVSNTFRTDSSSNLNICPCMQGFFDDGTSICKKCSYRCLNCVVSQSNCTFCRTNPGFFRDSISPLCNCMDGYFDDGIQIICQQCNPKCQTCINQADNCIICNQPSQRNLSPYCDCKQGYFEDQQKQCQLCSINCLSCQDNQKNCTTCQPDRIGKDCQCQDGFYEANLVLCQQCSQKCSTCQEHSLNCLTCVQGRINPPNCLCKDHFYDNFVDSDCQECDQYCGRCDMNGCIDCAANRIQFQKTCLCPPDSVSYTFTPYCSNCDVAVVKGLFSDDLSELIYIFEFDLQFNFPTQVDVQAYCQYLIMEQSLTLIGETPKCRIEQKQLIISLGSGSTILIGDEIQFNTEILKHTQCQSPLKLIINLELQRPTQLLKPYITVSYPNLPVSPCSSIEISIQWQSVNGQRNLKLRWQSSLSIPAIDIANQLQFQTLTIEQGQVPENSNIEIIIMYTNFLGQSGQKIVEFQTLSEYTPQFQFNTIQTSFISWAPIKLMVYFQNTICPQGVLQILKNPVQILFEEKITSRNPSQSKQIIFQQSSFDIEESDGLISTIIPARSLTVNTNYSIISKFSDLTTKQEIFAQFNIQIERSPLMVQIVGGSRTKNYLNSFEIQIQSKDPDLQVEWNQDPDIKLTVDCIDPQHQNQPCADQNNKTIHLNKTSNIQYIGARIFKPFTVLLFKVKCQKLDQKAYASAAIILLDADIPIIDVSYPQGYMIRDVNINEKLKFQIMVSKNQKLSDMDFSLAVIYDFETFFIRNIPNQFVDFAIWEGFDKFKFINQISLRFQAHDNKYLMPQTASITLQVNLPPVSSVISITPNEGFSLLTEYAIRITNSKDKDSPIRYRYAYYESWNKYSQDILSGRQENLIILQEFSSAQTFKTFFESGNLTILTTVADSLGSQVNFTQQIKSLSLFEQWYLSNDTNDQFNLSSRCKQMVSDLMIPKSSSQQLIIISQELIKLLQQKIQLDCKQTIYQKLKEIQFLLFYQLLTQSNAILKSRISNILSKIYELNITSTSRQLSSQQNSIVCYNTFYNQIQVSYLAKVNYGQSDSDQIINQISQMKIQIQKAIDQNDKLIKDQQLSYDMGDDQTVRSLQQNIELRISYIRILGSLFSNVYDQIIDELMSSFRLNLILDNDCINVVTAGLGVQVSKIGQKRFQSYIIDKQVKYEDLDLSNYIINRYLQLVKYRTNKYFYTETFETQFKNGFQLLERIETNQSTFEKSIIPYFESAMLDPQVFVDNTNQVTQVLKVFQGKLAFDMGVKLDVCDSNYTQQYNLINDYKFVCSSYRDQEWVHESCQVEYFSDNNSMIDVKCFCDQLYPLALMIMNISNNTKQQLAWQPFIRIEEYLNILIAENVTIHAILLIFTVQIGLATLMKIQKKNINLKQIYQSLKSQKQEEPIGLTKAPEMSTTLFKANIKYLHELTRLLFVNYIHLTFISRILLTSININLLLTSIHVMDVVIRNHFLSILISVMIQLVFQLFVKILEGFFNGPQTLKAFGYFLGLSINFGIISINILFNRYTTQISSFDQEYFTKVIYLIISLIIVYGPIEIMIQYMKLKWAFIIFEELRVDPFNPMINLIYYFLQDEIVISLVQGAKIY